MPRSKTLRGAFFAQPRSMEDDERYMAEALELAVRGRGWTSPNPMVGAVLVRDGRIVGRGYHPRVGAPHAEVFAMRDAGSGAKNARLYVTIEPCCIHGRTPPCVDAILKAGITEVVAPTADPDSRVRGRSFRMLRKAGVRVETGVLRKEARKLNEYYFQHRRYGRPFVIAKWAMTLDGKIATRTGDSRWITSPQARKRAHQLRAGVDAILVGHRTAVRDDPSLTIRHGVKGRQPVRIILSGSRRVPRSLNLIRTAGETPTWIAGAAVPAGPIGLPQVGSVTRKGKVRWNDLLDQLGDCGILALLIEGGQETLTSAMEAGIVNKVVAFVAPKWVGGAKAPTPAAGKGIDRMVSALQLKRVETEVVGPDILVQGYLQ